MIIRKEPSILIENQTDLNYLSSMRTYIMGVHALNSLAEFTLIQKLDHVFHILKMAVLIRVVLQSKESVWFIFSDTHRFWICPLNKLFFILFVEYWVLKNRISAYRLFSLGRLIKVKYIVLFRIIVGDSSTHYFAKNFFVPLLMIYVALIFKIGGASHKRYLSYYVIRTDLIKSTQQWLKQWRSKRKSHKW